MLPKAKFGNLVFGVFSKKLYEGIRSRLDLRTQSLTKPVFLGLDSNQHHFRYVHKRKEEGQRKAMG
jgi:hypothetical protein